MPHQDQEVLPPYANNQVAKRRKEKRCGVEIRLVKLSGLFSDILRFVVGKIETTSAVLGIRHGRKWKPAIWNFTTTHNTTTKLVPFDSLR